MEESLKEDILEAFSIADELAVERTILANDRTLLSFIRTSLYFAIAGLTITNLLDFKYEWLFSIVTILVAVLLLFFGFRRYYKLNRKLKSGLKDKSHFSILYHNDD